MSADGSAPDVVHPFASLLGDAPPASTPVSRGLKVALVVLGVLLVLTAGWVLLVGFCVAPGPEWSDFIPRLMRRNCHPPFLFKPPAPPPPTVLCPSGACNWGCSSVCNGSCTRHAEDGKGGAYLTCPSCRVVTGAAEKEAPLIKGRPVWNPPDGWEHQAGAENADACAQAMVSKGLGAARWTSKGGCELQPWAAVTDEQAPGAWPFVPGYQLDARVAGPQTAMCWDMEQASPDETLLLNDLDGLQSSSAMQYACRWMWLQYNDPVAKRDGYTPGEAQCGTPLSF